MRALVLAALFFAAPSAVKADALRHAALAALLIRQNPSDTQRRATLGAAFDADLIRPGEPEAVPGTTNGRRHNWFPKRLALEAERVTLQMPELPARTVDPSLARQAETALRAALAPWRALADAAWGGAWTGMVSVGLAEDGQR